MSQATNVIPDSDGGTFLTNLNAALAALASGHGGTADPTYLVAGMRWWRTNVPGGGVWTCYEYDGTHKTAQFTYDTSTGTLSLASGVAVATQSANDNSTAPASTEYADRQAGQMVSIETGAVASGATQIPIDDTVPQSTEGDQYMTLSITPKSASSKLVIDVTLVGSTNAGDWITAGLFLDSGAGAIAGAVMYNDTAFAIRTLRFTHVMNSPGTSTYTFKVRAGAANGATLTFNGTNGARRLGAVMASSIVIREVF